MSTEYDSAPDTQNHIARVQALIEVCRTNLALRAGYHDASKLEEPEKSAFDEATPRLAKSTYGSPEYKGFLADMQPALDHHYGRNSHHPEHYRWRCNCCHRSFSDAQAPIQEGGDQRFCPVCCRHGMIYEAELICDPDSGINGMSLLDVLEMLCDWKAAGERHVDGSMAKSLAHNRNRFHVSGQLQSILENTARELGWIPQL